jgi:two-component system, OmpR family, KDP operon response regulator KdpE
MKILMIEDDKTTVEVIRLTLGVNDPNINIISKEKGREGLATARSEHFDVVVLDLGLPDIDGMTVLEELRKFSKTPVLIVSARHDPAVITSALGLGAQDYILKPFKFQSFLTSLMAVTSSSQAVEDRTINWRITDDLTIRSNSCQVLVKGNQVEINEEEWKILNKLIEHSGRIVTTKELTEALSDRSVAGESSVHLIISRLRRKLGDDPYIPKIIVSEYECGYRFTSVAQNSGSENKVSFKIVSNT